MGLKLQRMILICLGLFQCIASGRDDSSPVCRIIFDDLHGQTYGNADWIPTQAYSSFADDIRECLNGSIQVTSECSRDGTIDAGVLKNENLLIIPEPNIRFTPAEIAAIRQFVQDGGAVFMIADHGESDRNFDGWDSPLIFNELADPWGVTFTGSTFSETPVRIVSPAEHPVLQSVRQVGAWAATSILIRPGAADVLPLIFSDKAGGNYMIAGCSGKGRFAAIGDSSPFDDGTGDESKNRHSAYHSFLYDHRRLAVQTCAWLTSRPPPEAPVETPPYPYVDQLQGCSGWRIVVDTAHGNNDADNLDCFLEDIEKNLETSIAFNRRSLDRLPDMDLLIIVNPTSGFADYEKKQIAEWVQKGGKLILASNNYRNPLNAVDAINGLLHSAGSCLKVNPDEIMDDVSNTGRPWAPVIKDFNPLFIPAAVDSAVFWGSASVAEIEGGSDGGKSAVFLAWGGPNARSTRAKKTDPMPGNSASAGARPAVAAMEKIGQGTIIVLGANTMSNFQYFTPEEQPLIEKAKWDHRTALFNLCIVKLLFK